MTVTQERKHDSGTNDILEVVRDADDLAVEAVRKFVETVNGILPDVRDDAVRRKIIDSAITMTQRVVDASSDFVDKVVAVARDAWAEAKDARGDTGPPG